LRSYKR